MYKYTIKNSGVMFNIVKNKDTITYIDEHNGVLTWIRTDYNEYLVDCMINELI